MTSEKFRGRRKKRVHNGGKKIDEIDGFLVCAHFSRGFCSASVFRTLSFEVFFNKTFAIFSTSKTDPGFIHCKGRIGQ